MAGMRLRHVTALALVGWYLMAPPLVNDQSQPDAPISRWTIIKSFDSAMECENRASELRQSSHVTELPTGPVKLRIFSTKCIVSDDPRLKEK